VRKKEGEMIKIKIFRIAGGWMWKIFARNGVTLAASWDIYIKKRDCLRAILHIIVKLKKGNYDFSSK
jgi:uncharacterized protein YegP (UPF0339 family)